MPCDRCLACFQSGTVRCDSRKLPYPFSFPICHMATITATESFCQELKGFCRCTQNLFTQTGWGCPWPWDPAEEAGDSAVHLPFQRPLRAHSTCQHHMASPSAPKPHPQPFLLGSCFPWLLSLGTKGQPTPGSMQMRTRRPAA